MPSVDRMHPKMRLGYWMYACRVRFGVGVPTGVSLRYTLEEIEARILLALAEGHPDREWNPVPVRSVFLRQTLK